MKTRGNGDYDTITFRMYANVCQSYTNHISLQKKKPLMRRLKKRLKRNINRAKSLHSIRSLF